jgi:hypothetical protein
MTAVSAGVPAVASGQTTALFIHSEPGSDVGGGRDWTYQPPGAVVTIHPDVFHTPIESVRFTFTTPQFEWWDVVVYGLPRIQVGTEIAFGPTWGGSQTPAPFIDVSGQAAGWNSVRGRFIVRELAYDAGHTSVMRFAADFEVHGDDVDPATFGAIRFNSTIADLTPFGGISHAYSLKIVESPFGRVTGAGIECGLGGTRCTQSFIVPTTVALTAIPAPGYALLGWQGSCRDTGTPLVRVHSPSSCTPLFGPVTPDAPRTLVLLNSVSGDPVGAGGELRLTPLNTIITAAGGTQPGSVHVQVWGRMSLWRIDFSPAPGQVLVPGEYTFQSVPFAATSGPAVFATGGTTCSAYNGRFVVYESRLADDGTLISFAADFEQQCADAGGSAGGVLYGAVRYNSTAFGVAPFGGTKPTYRLVLVPTDDASMEAAGLRCRSAVAWWNCSKNFASPLTVTLSAMQYDGIHLFESWTYDCAGSANPLALTLSQPVTVCSVRFAQVDPLRLTSFVASTSLPVVVGTPITWTAVANRASNIAFRFWRATPSVGTRQLVQDWSARSTYTWTPTAADVGSITVDVDVVDPVGGALFDDRRTMTFTVLLSAPPQLSCTTRDPFIALGGGTCVDGGWLPPGLAPPASQPPTPTPVAPPVPPAPSPGSCSTPDPFVSMGGGTCSNGGWLPPGIPAPSPSSPSPAVTPPVPPPPAPSSGSCSTPDPFAALGGGTCSNGGWLPPGFPPPSPSSPSPAVTPPVAPPPAPSSGSCSTPDPFAALGGGTCSNGGWLPPGISAPPPPPPAPPLPIPGACVGPDPFTSIGGGICVNGGWIPRSLPGGE